MLLLLLPGQVMKGLTGAGEAHLLRQTQHLAYRPAGHAMPHADMPHCIAFLDLMLVVVVGSRCIPHASQVTLANPLPVQPGCSMLPGILRSMCGALLLHQVSHV